MKDQHSRCVRYVKANIQAVPTSMASDVGYGVLNPEWLALVTTIS